MFDNLRIRNDGVLIQSTNFWDLSPKSCVLNLNQSCFRLLIPRDLEEELYKMIYAREVVIARGACPERGVEDMFEIIFDDFGKNPHVMYLPIDAAVGILPPKDETNYHWTFSAWIHISGGKPHKSMERKCYYWSVAQLPFYKGKQKGDKEC